VYLPHLHYCLQRDGPTSLVIAAELRQVDAVCGDLIGHFEGRGTRVFSSEHGSPRFTGPST
jgi:hypothetical protein